MTLLSEPKVYEDLSISCPSAINSALWLFHEKLESATPSAAKGLQFSGISTTKYGKPFSITPVTEGLSVSVVDVDSIEETVDDVSLDGTTDDASLVDVAVAVTLEDPKVMVADNVAYPAASFAELVLA